MPQATATKGVNFRPSIRTTNKLDFYWFRLLLASLKSQYRVLRHLFFLYLWQLGGYVPARYSGSQKSEVCPMPYALCPMPYALCPWVPHMRARKAISVCRSKLSHTFPALSSCY